MEKFSKYAEFPQVSKGVVFSDPYYDESVWCQYRKAFNPSSGWAMKMESVRDDDGYAEFSLLIGRRSLLSGLRLDEEAGTIKHYAHHQISDPVTLGMDTAQIYLGSLKFFEMYGEEASIRTGTDGEFGQVYPVTCKGEDEPAGFVLMAAIDTVITDEDELFRTVTAAFDGHEIDRERFEKITDPNSLEVRKQLSKEVQRAKALDHDDKRQPKKGRNDQER